MVKKMKRLIREFLIILWFKYVKFQIESVNMDILYWNRDTIEEFLKLVKNWYIDVLSKWDYAAAKEINYFYSQVLDWFEQYIEDKKKEVNRMPKITG